MNKSYCKEIVVTDIYVNFKQILLSDMNCVTEKKLSMNYSLRTAPNLNIHGVKFGLPKLIYLNYQHIRQIN